jgi:hypothetical protein
MSLRGSLSDLLLPDLLQMISANRKSGRLRVTTAHAEGLFVFREGRIIYGATNAHRETFGSALVLRGLITPAELQEALERKARAPEDRRLGHILLQMGAVTEEQLFDVLRGQLHEVTAEMFRWRQGVVEFEDMRIEPQGEVAVDAQDFLLRDGVSASGVLFSVAEGAEAAEATESAASEPILAGLDWVPEPGLPAGEAPTARVATSLTELRRELHTPLWGGEVALGILRAGAGVVSRGVLLMRAADGFRGLGQFGVWEGEQTERVRALRIANQSQSLLADVARSRRGFHGVPDRRPHSLLFFHFLETDPPKEAIVLPVVVDGEAQLLFYGDNSPSARPIAAIAEFEGFLAEVGRAMEMSK